MQEIAMDASLALHLEQFFPGDTELAALMRRLDWAKTDIGSPHLWPEHWRTALRLCLTSRIPVVMYWGPNFTVLYNDPYISFLGDTKHPHVLGTPGHECWAEIWDTIGPMLESVMRTGVATWSEDVMMFFARRLPREEVYVRFTFGPLLAADGRTVDGIFCPCTETTEQVVSARRLETLRKLGAKPPEALQVDTACRQALRVLAQNPYDIPLAALYLVDQSAGTAALVSHTGLHDDHMLPKTICSTDGERDPWGLAAVMVTHLPVELNLSAWAEQLRGEPWDEPTQQALVLPIAAPQAGNIFGVLLVGVSARRPLDAAYRTFFDLVTRHIGTAIADAKAYEQERQRAEALAEIDRAKTAFFSNVSHEFRTPLTLMMGPLEEALAAGAQRVAPEVHAELEVAHRNSLRLLKLVNSLLDFSRIEGGRMQAVYEPVDLAAFTSELASVFRSAMTRAGLQYEVECQRLPAPVYVDRDMWEKIVLNLLSNAFKYTLHGTVRLQMRENDGAAELAITDSGIGIPDDALPHLFERFYRVPNAQGRTYEGSGIGLSLVQELVKLHGGTIDVYSRLGEGTTFTVRVPTGHAHLPADRIQAARSLPSTAVNAVAFVEEAVRWLPPREEVSLDDTEPFATLPVTPADLTGNLAIHAARSDDRPVLLLADDNADMREYLRRLLETRFRVVTAVDGAEALELLHQHAPELILTDVMMPGTDGFAVLDAVRSNPATRDLPVIMLSARAGEEGAHRRDASGRRRLPGETVQRPGAICARGYARAALCSPTAGSARDR
jgi:signal transduction histidine kinase